MPRRQALGHILGNYLTLILNNFLAERCPKLEDVLETCMPHMHVFLTAGEREVYNETPKEGISINTAAIKHIILKEAMAWRQINAFSHSCKVCKDKLVQVVFKELADKSSFYTQHAFFDDELIGKFSTSVPVTDINEDLACEAQNQCHIILENIYMDNVSYISYTYKLYIVFSRGWSIRINHTAKFL